MIAQAPTTSAAATHFANFDRLVRTWYFAMPSAALKSKPRRVDLHGLSIVLWRDATGQPIAFPAQCPHLGADLSQGTIKGSQLRCPFHQWAYDADGRCVDAPGCGKLPNRSTQRWATAERLGLIWFCPGKPPFPLEQVVSDDIARGCPILRPRPRHINCHPHVVLANGLDMAHVEPMHAMRYGREPRVTLPDNLRVSVSFAARPASVLLRALTGTSRVDCVSRFTTVGTSLAWYEVESPFQMRVLFTTRPSAQRGCDTQIVLLLPRGFRAIGAMALMSHLLREDARILNSLRFTPAFSEVDEPLRLFAEVADRMEAM